MTPKIEIYQIAYNQDTQQQAQESGFRLLDNTSNVRPDWYEYWAIRSFLLNHTLEPETWYGFFSPKFTAKTTLRQSQVVEQITEFCKKGSPDVVLFSPQPDMGAFFLNVFEQAETFDPGFLDTATRVFQQLGLTIPLQSLVMDSRQVVFSNYFVAKREFWMEWFKITEAIFALGETPNNPVAALLCTSTSYPGAAQRKVFLIERIASFLLAIQPHWKTAAANTFNFGWSVSKFRNYPEEAYMSDALKMAFRETQFPQYITAFSKLRSVFTPEPPPPSKPVTNEQPEISIIVPTFKRPEKLKRALESIPKACTSPFEIIVIDDCPEGSGFVAARQFGARYINKAGVNRGQSFSRNMGLDIARGRWVSFLDDDDYYLPAGLDALLGVAPKGMKLVFGNYHSFNAQSRIEVNLGNITSDVLMVCNQIPMGAFIIERSSLVRGFDTRMRSHEDWDFLLSNLSQNAIQHVPASVVAIDKTENQTTSTEARRRSLFWLDFLSIYSRFPAPYLNQQRHDMLLSLGIDIDKNMLAHGDTI